MVPQSAWLHSRRAEASAPPEIKRARVVVDNAGVKRLALCESCGEEKYIAEGHTVCEECRAHRRRRRKAKS